MMEQKEKRCTFDSPITGDMDDEINVDTMLFYNFGSADETTPYYSFKNEVQKVLKRVEEYLVTPELMSLCCKYNISQEDIEKLKNVLFSKHKKEIVYRICQIFDK